MTKSDVIRPTASQVTILPPERIAKKRRLRPPKGDSIRPQAVAPSEVGAIQQAVAASPEERQPEHGHLYKHPKSGIYLCRYYSPTGKQLHRSTGTTNREQALDFLAGKVAETKSGDFDEISVEKVTCSELFGDTVRDYERKGQRSIQDIEIRWHKHLAEHFGGSFKAMNVTSKRLNEYVEWRQKQKASASSINRELALLRRMLKLGAQCTPRKVRLDHIPHFPMLAENNIREGFLGSADYDRLAQACSKVGGLWLRAALELAFTTGWRREAVISLKLSAFDPIAGTLRLSPQQAKNKTGLLIGLTQSLRVLLGQLALGKGPHDALFTHDDGSPVISFRGSWHRACLMAGLAKLIHSCGTEVASRGEGRRTRYHCSTCERDVHASSLEYRGLLYHDLRRSAAMSFAASGTPLYTIKRVMGIKTDSIFDRYNIADVKPTQDAMRRLEQHREQVAVEIAAAKNAAEKSDAPQLLSHKQDNLAPAALGAQRGEMLN